MLAPSWMEYPDMNEIFALPLIDLISLGYILLGALVGLKRGLSCELSRLASIVIAVFAGWRLHGPIGRMVEHFTRLEGTDAFLVGFLTVILGAGALMALLRWSLRKVMAMSFHPLVNRIGGGVAGGIRALLIASVLFIGIGMSRSNYLQRKFIDESVVGTFVMDYVLPLYTAFRESAEARAPDAAEEAEKLEP